jgi:hypothetical protein
VKRALLYLVCLLAGTRLAVGASSNLMINGSCDDPENPFKYWTYDYKEGGSNYADNDKYVSMLPNYDGKKNVIKMVITEGIGMGQGVLVDSPFVPFEQGCRYRFTVSFQASGPYHMYVMGYLWKPGVKPYANPSLFDLRPRYKGTFNTVDDRGVRVGAWTKVVREWPEKQLSNLAMPIVKDVKLMSLHICGITGKGEIYLKDLFVEKLPDKYTGGKITDDDRRKTKQGAK